MNQTRQPAVSYLGIAPSAHDLGAADLIDSNVQLYCQVQIAEMACTCLQLTTHAAHKSCSVIQAIKLMIN